jgi:ribonuclease G
MSKELIVSANRHETRVAVMEDDQVVEVYHQREQEYSLAGSIHKGRVTRVLPGMQSAFVDIGLDRDAFLYVSDFFEDNDEYDKIVTSVEEKVFKMEKGPAAGGAPLPVAVAAPTAPAPTEAAAELPAPVAAQPAPAPVAAPVPQSAPSQFARRDDDRDRDRRGRRSRRRRPRGRGLPESKYFSPGQQVESAPPPPAPEEAAEAEAEPDEDIMVLPGESLAKYREPGETEPRATETEPSASEAEPPAPETEPVELASGPPEDVGEPAPVAEYVEEVPEAVEIIAAAVVEIAETEPVEEPEETAQADDAPQAVVPSELAEAVETVEFFETPEGAEALAESETPDGAELTAEPPVEGQPSEEELGPEPARIPTSLTATLREQGPRFMHRVSRRMRRRGRGDGADFQQRGDPNREPRPQEGRPQEGRPHETRAQEPRTDVRPVSRPERPERPEPARVEKAGTPSISDLLREGQEIIVQIAKEPLGQKGARITSHIALPGRFLVYMPTVDHIGVSRKIPSDEERLRLKRILQANRTGIPGGYIVRTAGDGRTEEELRADMLFLYNLWLDLRQKAEKKPAPLLVHHDLGVVERILRDQLTSSFKSIWVDNEEVYENVLRFVQRFQPALVGRVKLYTRSTPIFDEYGITTELEKALRPKVWLKTGGHIVINQTEALVAIDVNTGKYVGKSNRLEDTIVKTNTDAIKEIVRQIRLRDLGGIIVVDFIDMDERKNRQKVMQVLEEAMRADRAPYKILQFNDFGLVAITRKRVKQSLERTLCVPCPYCDSSGWVKSAQTVIGEILQEAQKIARAVEGNSVMLRVNPEVAKVLKSNQNSYLQEIEEILGRTVLVKSDPLLHQEKFDLA